MMISFFDDDGGKKGKDLKIGYISMCPGFGRSPLSFACSVCDQHRRCSCCNKFNKYYTVTNSMKKSRRNPWVL